MQAIGASNTTFRNVQDGQLGVDFNTLLGYTPPPLSTNFFPRPQTPQPTNYPSASANYGTPTFQPPPTGNQTSLSLANIFNTSSGLASQLITAFGKNPNQQITGSSQVQALVAPTQPGGYNGSGGISAEQQLLLQQQQAALAANNGAGTNALKAGTGILDGLAASFGISTTTLLIGGVVGAVLLFKKPPTRGR